MNKKDAWPKRLPYTYNTIVRSVCKLWLRRTDTSHWKVPFYSPKDTAKGAKEVTYGSDPAHLMKGWSLSQRISTASSFRPHVRIKFLSHRSIILAGRREKPRPFESHWETYWEIVKVDRVSSDLSRPRATRLIAVNRVPPWGEKREHCVKLEPFLW